MRTVNIATLGLGAKAGICWSFFWRGMLVTAGSMLVGALLGGILGAILGFGMAAAGLPKGSGMGLIQLAGGGVGVLSGFCFLYLYVRWLLTSRLGGYRLLLVSASEVSNSSFHATAPGGV